MGKRIVGYVISHTGKPGGPWECDDFGAWGISTAVAKDRIVWCANDHGRAAEALSKIQRIHPAARILRLVRRERHRAEEDEVIRLAMAYFLTTDMANGIEFHDVLQACAALRAKRGGK